MRRVQAGHPLLRPRREPGPPHFVGIGAQRCGTTWWHSLIEEHPLVVPLGLGAKELHFFDHRWATPFQPEDRSLYWSNFLRRPGQITGEWTPRYLYDAWAVPMLLDAAPDARLLVMLRDPVARFVSGLAHAHKTRSRLGPDDVTESFLRGLYATQLSRLLQLVPREQVHVLQFERCVQEPALMLRRTFEFLELPPADVAIGEAVNASRTRVDVPQSVIDEVRARYADDVVAAAKAFPEDIDLDLWTTSKN